MKLGELIEELKALEANTSPELEVVMYDFEAQDSFYVEHVYNTGFLDKVGLPKVAAISLKYK